MRGTKRDKGDQVLQNGLEGVCVCVYLCLSRRGQELLL